MKKSTQKFIEKEFEIEYKVPKVIQEMYLDMDWTDRYPAHDEETVLESRRLCYERD